MNWFRFYGDAVNDPKVQQLPAELFKFWVNCLCLASKNHGIIPSLKDCAWSCRMTTEEAQRSIQTLQAEGLIDEAEEGVLTPHNWEERQFLSDSCNERVRRYREKIKATGETTDGYRKHTAFVFERDGCCVYCGKEATCLDHLVPVARGGDGKPDNLVAACKRCNSGKSGRLIEETTYSFFRKETAAQYEAVKARISVTVSSPQRVTVTETPPDTESEQNQIQSTPPPPYGGNAPAPAGACEASQEGETEAALPATPSAPSGDRKKRKDADPDFEAFWDRYAYKDNRKDAERAWAKSAKTRPPLPELLAAVDRLHQTRRWQEGFRPYASTWLNGERWTNEGSPGIQSIPGGAAPARDPDEYLPEFNMTRREYQETYERQKRIWDAEEAKRKAEAAAFDAKVRELRPDFDSLPTWTEKAQVRRWARRVLAGEIPAVSPLSGPAANEMANEIREATA